MFLREHEAIEKNSNGFNANGGSNGSSNPYQYNYGYDDSGRGGSGSYGDIFDYFFN